MALSDKEQLMIMKQVALKAGVDLVKERTNIPADIAEHTNEAIQYNDKSYSGTMYCTLIDVKCYEHYDKYFK